MTRYCLIGPTYPYRGGIAHYTTLLAQQLLRETKHDLLFISFSQQYPAWLFPGRSDKEVGEQWAAIAAEYILNPLNPLSWWHTLRRIQQWQPDAVIVPWWHPFFAPAWGVLGRGLKHMAKKATLVYVCHNVLPHEASLFDKAALRFALAPADGYLVHAQSEAERLQLFLPQAQIRINPHPTYAVLAEHDWGQDDAALSLPAQCPVLLFCGLVRPYKGLDILLRALPLVLAQQHVHLAVVGEFWKDKPTYMGLIDELKLADHVTIVDAYVSNALLAAYVRRANVVVVPYRTATQSGVVQLAFGAGTPVITTNVGGLAEAVAHGETGLVVEPEDPVALAGAINDYLGGGLEVVFRRRIEGENGRFSWHHLVNQLENFVRE